VRANNWTALEVLEPDAYDPTLSVSVVIPAYQAGRTLPYTLAALAAQTYPSRLLEVVVVDDRGNNGALELPELRPENTRVVPVSHGWGRANACHEGARAAAGEVIHWLDADMVPCRDEVARQLRWHHALDHAVVLGHKLFVDAEALPPVPEVHRAVLDGTLEALFDGRWVAEHDWVEVIWRRSNDLTSAGFRAFHVHVGATASVRRCLYVDAGGMDPSLKLGEDVELGYRLSAKGAVFVAERTATSWHLGRSNQMKDEEQTQRYNAPFTASRVPDFRKFREERGRSYDVPYVEVVVHSEGHTWEEVKHTVDGVLAVTPDDIVCRLVGDWSELTEDRRQPLLDPLLDLRLLHEEYRADARVELVEEVTPTAFPAQFRLRLPVGWRPGRGALTRLVQDMQKRSLGLRLVLLPDGQVARLERTAAFERALRVMRADEDLDDVVDTVAGSWWSEGEEDGFQHRDRRPPTTPRRRAARRRPEDERSRATSDEPLPRRSSWSRPASAVVSAGRRFAARGQRRSGSAEDRRPTP
jgi:GT2 family glycosyltransferase